MNLHTRNILDIIQQNSSLSHTKIKQSVTVN